MKIATKVVRNTCLMFCGAMLLFTANPSLAGEPRSKEEIGQIIREYLIENPEIMIEVQQALEEKQRQELAENQRRIIAENRDLIYSSPFQINFGDENAETTIVEFFDYNCGFCKAAMEDMQRFLDTDKNVRFVLKEFPVLGQESLQASRVSLAFGRLKPELHAQYHINLLSLEGIKDGARAIDLAKQMGVSQIELELEMDNPEIMDAIQDVYRIAEGLGINGTPSYIAGEEVVFGAVGYDELKATLNRQTN